MLAQTVEAFFLMWRATGEPIWRERGWAVFEAVERTARTRVGYASIKYADTPNPPQLDDMPRCVPHVRRRTRS
jgi:hypothetical protein